MTPEQYQAYYECPEPITIKRLLAEGYTRNGDVLEKRPSTGIGFIRSMRHGRSLWYIGYGESMLDCRTVGHVRMFERFVESMIELFRGK